MVSIGVLFRVSMMFLKRNEQELYKEMDEFVDDETAIFHKMKVGKLLSGMSSKTEGSNETDQFRFLERQDMIFSSH